MEKNTLTNLTRGKTRKKKISKAMVLGAACLCVLGAAAGQIGAHAYMSANAFVQNNFDEGKVTIRLEEPGWTNDSKQPGNKTNVLSGDVFTKDPTVVAEDTCVTPSFVYMQIRVPFAKVTKVNDDSTLYDMDENGGIAKKNHMLLTFGEGEIKKSQDDLWDIKTPNTVSFDDESKNLDAEHNVTNNINNTKDGWTLLSVEQILAEDIKDSAYNKNVEGYLIFTYAYNSLIANTSKMETRFQNLKGTVITNKTTPLFNKVRTVNCIEGQLDGVEYKMPIKAFAIQATHTGTYDDENLNNSADGNGNGIPTTTETVIKQAKAAYATYVKQNKDSENATVSVSTFAN